MLKYLRPISLALIAVGIIWLIYSLLSGSANYHITRTIGFFLFAVGMLIYSYMGIKKKV